MQHLNSDVLLACRHMNQLSDASRVFKHTCELMFAGGPDRDAGASVLRGHWTGEIGFQLLKDGYS